MIITINNQTFDITAEQEEKLRKALGVSCRRLHDVAIGETFTVADIEFIKFSEENGAVAAVAKNVLFNASFDDTDNNFATSDLLQRLNRDVLPKLGADNLLEFETDLMSVDGLNDYGTVKSKISLPTFDFYRKHVKLFDKYKVNKWWWLATPQSTKTHEWKTAVSYVCGDGTLGYSDCGYDCGVRPFCIFKSSIFVS